MKRFDINGDILYKWRTNVAVSDEFARVIHRTKTLNL